MKEFLDEFKHLEKICCEIYGQQHGLEDHNMGLFKTKAEKELDGIIRRLETNMANNYKDNAQSNLKELEASVELLRSSGRLKAARLAEYESLLGIYKEKLKGFTHKDQKPYWT